MKFVMLFVLYLCFHFSSFSQTDTAACRQRVGALDIRHLTAKDFKYKTAQLVDRYAFNDTAAAIIHLYKGRGAANGTVSSLIGLGVTIAVFAQSQSSMNNTSTTTSSGTGGGKAIVPLLGAAALGIYLGVKGLFTWGGSSLLKTLHQYENTGVVPKKIIRKLKPKYFHNASTKTG